MTDQEKLAEIIAGEEFMIRQLNSDLGKVLLASALRRAGVRDEAEIVTNALLTREESAPPPYLLAEGVVAYLTAALEAGLVVRRAAVGEDTE